MTRVRYCGYCRACDHWMWTYHDIDGMLDDVERWVPVRCAGCGRTTQASKDGELGRPRPWARVESDLVVDWDQPDAVTFDGVVKE